MDEVAARAVSDLYEDDFYAWTQMQAALLREGRLDEADIFNILEEIETLGRKEVAELASRLTVLLHHLLKEKFQPNKASRSWALTIIDQRRQITRLVVDNPSLKPKLSQAFGEAYVDALDLAVAETGLPLATFPAEPFLTYAQAVDRAFWPGRAILDRN